MKILLFLVLYITTVLSNTATWNIRPSDHNETVEEKIERGYQILKDEAHAADTKAFLLKLHDVEQGRETELDQQHANLPDDMKRYLNINFDEVKQMGDTIVAVNEKSHVEMALYQGDIMLTKEQGEQIINDIEQNDKNRLKRQAYHPMTFPMRLWSDGVSYTFHNASGGARKVFRRAVEIWQNVTCINFTENSTAVDKIIVVNSSGCWSELGKLGGDQVLSLGNGSKIPRRWISFEDDWKSQLIKESNITNYNYGLTYDYGSVMHYGARTASKNYRFTMIPQNDVEYVLTLGSDILAFYDMMMMNLHYGCLDRCGGVSSSKCANGGIPHPRNCSKCLCPSGYAGDLCTERPSTGCGATLIANFTEQTLTVTMGDRMSRILKDEFDLCHYWLQGPKNSRIRVVIDGYWGITAGGCKYGGVEIKTGEDKRYTGYRICSNDFAGVILTSTHNTVPVIVFNRYHSNTVTLRYQIGST
ncbi:astacin [Dictyocaulus viviparus]|uniref:Zinc metalloproteinase n=1 Tax=Dictyocaulus viviparus TaxID=29172 RepID=A0A0D8Y0I6_DICVI|nr:astacin [Dictyocaulus viviparus]